jgi:hypothetical protein
MKQQPEPEMELPLPPPPPSCSSGKLCGRWATLTGTLLGGDTTPVRYVEGASYDGVQLGPDAKDVEHNSVLLIPGQPRHATL